jgi:hypothetical protein
MRNTRCWALGTLLGFMLVGCAHEREVVRLGPGAAASLKDFDLHKQTLIIELRQGEVVPLDVIVEGDFFATAPGASVSVTAKQTCFIRVDDRGIRFSTDDQNFDEKPRVPGSFQFGVGVTPEGKRGTLRVSTGTR